MLANNLSQEDQEKYSALWSDFLQNNNLSTTGRLLIDSKNTNNKEEIAKAHYLDTLRTTRNQKYSDLQQKLQNKKEKVKHDLRLERDIYMTIIHKLHTINTDFINDT